MRLLQKSKSLNRWQYYNRKIWRIPPRCI